MLKQLLIGLVLSNLAFAGEQGVLMWEERGSAAALPDIPDKEGFAGVFSGVVSEGEEDFLVVAGGANFPQGRPWDGGKKYYYDDVFLLPLKDGAEWKKSEAKLPVKIGYGMSVTLKDGRCLFLGGKNEDGAVAQVLEVAMVGGKLTMDRFVDLPVALCESACGLVGDQVIVGGGAVNDGEGGFTAMRECYAFQILERGKRDEKEEWKKMGWPEGARGKMHPVTGVRDGMFYLFGGRDFADSEGEQDNRVVGLDFQKDCWALSVESGEWKQLADMPVAISAAPSTAVPSGVSHLLILGGVTAPFWREQIEARPALNGQGLAHPGFGSTVLAYDTLTNTWAEAGNAPKVVKDDHGENAAGSTWAAVTTPVVLWKGKIIVPTGEIKPGVRSPQVMIGKVAGQKASFGTVNWIVVALYLLGMVAVGYYFMKKESASSTDAYFRGGQRIPFWVAGLSIFATMLSAITFMAIPGTAYATNWNGYIGQWQILIVVPLVVMFYLPFYRKLNITTAYEYLEKRFNVASRVIASVTFMIFHVGRVAIVLYLPALALSSVTNIDIFVAIGVIGILCVIYTVMGGIEAVVWTDAIQALVLIGGALLCFGLVVNQVDGGLGAVTSAMSEQGKGITASWKISDISYSSSSTSGIVLFVAFLFANMPSYTSGQDVVQRYVTTSSEKEAARSLWMNIVMVLLGSAIFFGLGTALFVFYQEKPDLLDPALPAKDAILPYFIMQNLPVGVAGLIIAGVFAASQSTISSSLNSVATAFVTDIYGRLLKPESSDAQRLAVARRVVILLGVVGMGVSSYIAYTKVDSAFMLFNTFIGLALGPLGGLFALGIFTKRVSGKAGLLALVVGVAGVATIHVLNTNGVIDIMGLLYGFCGFMGTFVVGYLLSFIFPASEEEYTGLCWWSRN